ncbi:MAG: hypothetical protein AB7I79_11700 [Rhizobiaceae bacterium]
MAAAPALAADGMIDGVYARSPEQCDAARADFQAFIETGEIILTPSGIEGLEYNCEFLDWKRSTRSPGAIVTALCQEPGYAYPEIFAVMPQSEGQVDLTVSLAAGADGANTNAGTYHLCEGVAPP